MRRTQAASIALGLLLSALSGHAWAADQKFTVTCTFDPTESSTDPLGTVADGLGGPGMSLEFDLEKSVVRFRDGATLPLTKATDETIVFQEREYTVTFNRETDDLISHVATSDHGAYDGTFHCVHILRPN